MFLREKFAMKCDENLVFMPTRGNASVIDSEERKENLSPRNTRTPVCLTQLLKGGPAYKTAKAKGFNSNSNLIDFIQQYKLNQARPPAYQRDP